MEQTQRGEHTHTRGNDPHARGTQGTKERPGEAVTPQSGCFHRGSEETREKQKGADGDSHRVDVPTGTTRTNDELSHAGRNARSALRHAGEEHVLVQGNVFGFRSTLRCKSRT